MKSLKCILITFLAVSLSGCPFATDSPEAIAERFWETLNTDIEQAKTLVTEHTKMVLNSIEKIGHKNLPDVSILSSKLEGDKAIVKTSADVESSDGSGAANTIVFETILLKVDGTWKVDAQKSIGSMAFALMSHTMETMQKAVKQNAQNLIDENNEKNADEISAPSNEAKP